MAIRVIDIELDYSISDEHANLNILLNDGWTIIGSSTWKELGGLNYERYTLHKPDTTGETIQSDDITLSVITRVEGRSGYSKTQDKHFLFWTCHLANGEYLNIHDHPDESRNTFSIVKAAGWEQQFPDEDVYEDICIPVVIRKKGDWWNLIKMLPVGEYQSAWDCEESSVDDVFPLMVELSGNTSELGNPSSYQEKLSAMTDDELKSEYWSKFHDTRIYGKSVHTAQDERRLERATNELDTVQFELDKRGLNPDGSTKDGE